MSPNQHTAIMLLPLAGLALAGVVCLAVWYWRHGRPGTPLAPAAAGPVQAGPSADDEVREARLAAQIARMERYGINHPGFGFDQPR